MSSCVLLSLLSKKGWSYPHLNSLFYSLDNQYKAFQPRRWHWFAKTQTCVRLGRQRHFSHSWALQVEPKLNKKACLRRPCCVYKSCVYGHGVRFFYTNHYLSNTSDLQYIAHRAQTHAYNHFLHTHTLWVFLDVFLGTFSVCVQGTSEIPRHVKDVYPSTFVLCSQHIHLDVSVMFSNTWFHAQPWDAPTKITK